MFLHVSYYDEGWSTKELECACGWRGTSAFVPGVPRLRSSWFPTPRATRSELLPPGWHLELRELGPELSARAASDKSRATESEDINVSRCASSVSLEPFLKGTQ
jgi:hypothetical protein